MNLLLVQGDRQHSTLLQDVGRTHRWCVGKNFISLNLPCPLGTFDLIFFFSQQKVRILEAPQKRKLNWLSGRGRAASINILWKAMRRLKHAVLSCHII